MLSYENDGTELNYKLAVSNFVINIIIDAQIIILMVTYNVLIYFVLSFSIHFSNVKGFVFSKLC